MKISQFVRQSTLTCALEYFTACVFKLLNCRLYQLGIGSSNLGHWSISFLHMHELDKLGLYGTVNLSLSLSLSLFSLEIPHM